MQSHLIWDTLYTSGIDEFKSLVKIFFSEIFELDDDNYSWEMNIRFISSSILCAIVFSVYNFLFYFRSALRIFYYYAV